jgi:hypothetical protein
LVEHGLEASTLPAPGGYGAVVPESLFLFTQFEFPWQLGPPDGRYLLRELSSGEPEWVVVLGTLGAGRSQSERHPFRRTPARQRPSRLTSLRKAPPADPEPALVATARATIIDPVPLSAESQAKAWLSEVDAEHEVERTLAVLNRVLYSQRLAAADPYVHEVSPAQALVIRAGFGIGEQVADGRWLEAHELPKGERRPSRRGRIGRDRSAALRPHERLAELLGAREVGLVCEELALRSRLDLDQGRRAHAAIGLDGAYAAALSELHAEGRPDLAIRVDELRTLRAGVARTARAALAAISGSDEYVDRPADPETAGAPEASAGEEAEEGSGEELPERETPAEDDVVLHALERLEAALRARTATGFGR